MRNNMLILHGKYFLNLEHEESTYRVPFILVEERGDNTEFLAYPHSEFGVIGTGRTIEEAEASLYWHIIDIFNIYLHHPSEHESVIGLRKLIFSLGEE